MSELLTIADAAGWKMRETAHLNGGKEWFGYRYTCTEQPRLSRMDRYLRKDRSVQSTWRVDGEDMPSFEAAVEALNTPPTFTPDEVEAMRALPAETVDLRKALPIEVMYSLNAKGALSTEGGHGTLSDVGLAALRARASQDGSS